MVRLNKIAVPNFVRALMMISYSGSFRLITGKLTSCTAFMSSLCVLIKSKRKTCFDVLTAGVNGCNLHILLWEIDLGKNKFLTF